MSTVPSIAMIIYGLASALQLLAIRHEWRASRFLIWMLGLAAVCLHGLLLHEWIDLRVGQNLDFFNLFSMTMWLIVVLSLVVMLYQSIELLVLLVFPVAALSIGLVLAFPGEHVLHTLHNKEMLFHILLAIVTTCVLGMAGLFAILLAVQERCLRIKRMSLLVEKLPPVQTMEHLLFQVIGLGFVLLNVLIVTSLYFYHAGLWSHPGLVQKTLLACLAWLIFAILLLGRLLKGWRGRQVLYYTLLGELLMVVIYFGSKLILELTR